MAGAHATFAALRPTASSPVGVTLFGEVMLIKPRSGAASAHPVASEKRSLRQRSRRRQTILGRLLQNGQQRRQEPRSISKFLRCDCSRGHPACECVSRHVCSYQQEHGVRPGSELRARLSHPTDTQRAIMGSDEEAHRREWQPRSHLWRLSAFLTARRLEIAGRAREELTLNRR
jgi:hypothetical protein